MRYVATLLVLGALGAGSAPAANATPVQRVCPAGSGFAVVKRYDSNDQRKNTDWSVTYNGRLVYDFNEGELNGIFGGYSSGHGGAPTIDCSDVIVGGNVFGLQVGWKRDLFIGFGIQRQGARVTGVNMLRYYPHDSRMALRVLGANEVGIVYGRLADLNAHLCWDPNSESWFHNPDHRAGMGACTSNAWPWSYSSSSTTNVRIQ